MFRFFYLLSFILFFLSGSLYPINLDLNSDQNWTGFLTNARINQSLTDSYITNSPKKRFIDSDTDLALTFDVPNAREASHDETGHYRILEQPKVIADPTLAGNQLLALSNKVGLSLLAEQGLFLKNNQQSNFPTSFTIEFSFIPLGFSGRDIIFNYTNNAVHQDEVTLLQLAYLLDGRKPYWLLKNLFKNSQDQWLPEIRLYGGQLVPNSWYSVRLSYNAEKNYIEYYLNDVLQSITYTTPSGRRDDANTYLLSSADDTLYKINIGRNFLGYLDNFYIIRNYIQDPPNNKIRLENKNFVLSPIIDLQGQKSMLNHIDFKQITPGNSEIRTYYKLSNDKKSLENLQRFSVIQLDSLADWTHIKDPKQTIGEEGRFLLIKTELFADSRNNVAPLLENITVQYSTQNLPETPQITYESTALGKGQLVVKNSRYNKGIVFEVFLRQEDNSYINPITPFTSEETRIVLENLIPGQEYVAVVRAYYNDATDWKSEFSNEIFFRP